MIDPVKVDALFEQEQATGMGFRFALFDKRVLLSMSQLSEVMKAEAQEDLSLAELETRASRGWFPILTNQDGERGVPLYVPPRVGLFRSLEREGWTSEELRLAACAQEWKIDNLLAADELAYTDDDLETLVLFTRARIDALQEGKVVDGQGQEINQDEDLASEREQLEVFETMQRSGIPPHLALRVKKHAFRVRALNDVTRMWLLDLDEAQLRAGYGPTISFSNSSRGPEGFQGEIDWHWTIRAAMADADPDEPPLRVPGFLLRGVQVVTTRTFRPTEYGAAWRKHDIDGYLQTWLKLHNERRCLNCCISLAADERGGFCGEKCRNAVKQRRHRERNPESVERAQAKYWRRWGPADGDASGS
jgi:hypothetical protein